MNNILYFECSPLVGLLRDTDLEYLLLNYSVLGEPEHTHKTSVLLYIKSLWKDFSMVMTAHKEGSRVFGQEWETVQNLLYLWILQPRKWMI